MEVEACGEVEHGGVDLGEFEEVLGVLVQEDAFTVEVDGGFVVELRF